MSFTEVLISWFSKNKRTLPWRQNRSPYKVWLSEIILQQTRIDQGKSYYLKFIDRFPDVGALASAEQSEILKLWQGLGYYSRARNLHYAAQQVMHEFGGVFPDNYRDLLRLKGVGPYSAAAIASICFNEPVAVVDGNVFRFLGRHFGIEKPIDTTEGKKQFHAIASELLSPIQPGAFNEAMMEFGATVCKPSAPDCSECPFRISCYAFRHDAINELPVKSRKVSVESLYIEYFVVMTPAGFYLRKRPSDGIWGGMYDFPGISAKRKPTPAAISKSLKELGLLDQRTVYISSWYSHILTHRRISARFRILETGTISVPPDFKLVGAPEDLNDYALPRLIERFIDDRIFSMSGKL